MTPEERDLISGLFNRLKNANPPSKDAEADALISRSVAEFPAAPYLLVQTVLVQEHALNAAQAHISALEKELADARASQAANQPQPARATSFLGGLTSAFSGHASQAAPPAGAGPWGARAPAMAPPAYAQPPAYSPSPAYAQPSSGNSFLHSALSTAAGVAGGAMLFQGIERLFGHGMSSFGGGFGSPWGSNAGFMGGGMPPENVTVNNYYDNGGPGQDMQSAGAGMDPNNGANFQDASYDPGTDNGGGYDSGSFDDGSGGGFDDGSGGGDWT